jgi:hypothetical protein
MSESETLAQRLENLKENNRSVTGELTYESYTCIMALDRITFLEQRLATEVANTTYKGLLERIAVGVERLGSPLSGLRKYQK